MYNDLSCLFLLLTGTSYRDIMHCNKKPFYLKREEDSIIMDAYLMHAVSASPFPLSCIYDPPLFINYIFLILANFTIFLFSDKSCFQNKRYCEQEQHKT